MRRFLLELLRVMLLIFVLGPLMNGIIMWGYGVFGVKLESAFSIVGVFIAVLLLLLMVYRNYLQFSGWIPGDPEKKLTGKRLYTLLFFVVFFLVLAPMVSNFHVKNEFSEAKLGKVTQIDLEVLTEEDGSYAPYLNRDVQFFEPVQEVLQSIQWKRKGTEGVLLGKHDVNLTIYYHEKPQVYFKEKADYMIWYEVDGRATVVNGKRMGELDSVEAERLKELIEEMRK